MQTVLISGASIAGPALAFWLRRRGFIPEELARTRDHSHGSAAYHGLAAYERRMRPFVALNQAVALNDGAGIDHARTAFNLDE